MARNNKQYHFIPRWEIKVNLTTRSFLHIGCDEFTDRPGLEIEQKDGSKVKAEINAFIKDSNGKPYLPGSTIKGNIRKWLETNKKADEETCKLFNTLLGFTVKMQDEGCGGSAEFHNAVISSPLEDGNNFPYWDVDLQTSVETSTVIDRVTGTVVDGRLFSTEVVPPEVSFTLIITGAMTEQQVSLLTAVIKDGFAEDCPTPITIGADSGNGFGRFRFDSIHMKCLGTGEVLNWLEDGSQDMAATAMRSLSPDDIEQHIIKGRNYLKSPSVSDTVTIEFGFAGPFLVNDPSRKKRKEDIDHQPLRDSAGNARLPAKSIRGAMRSQAEKIIRTLGGWCCDPVNPCPSVFSVVEINDRLCLACRVFGATGWKSRISIQKVEYKGTAESTRQETVQDFVAIDRFHGGGKETAKFDASFSWRPQYSILMHIPSDLEGWAKGLLALTFRDFKEGDIFLGYGRSKGYGRVDSDSVKPGIDTMLTESNLELFRRKCDDNPGEYPCKTRQPPNLVQPVERNNLTEAADEGSFHNPYHFIPTPKPMIESWLAKEDFDETMHDSHALYRDVDENEEPLYHGKISCTLTTETPVFVGGKHDPRNDTEPQQVDHYTENGEIAIPATTLRGLLSSLSEAASNSSMRVLDDGMMSYRQPVGSGSLSAIGMVVIRDGKKFIYPLALPIFGERDKLPQEYHIMFPYTQKAPLKVYLERAYLAGNMKSFLDKQNSWNLLNEKIFYLPVPEFSFSRVHTMGAENRDVLKISRRGNLILGARLPVNLCPRSKEKALPGDIPGILRILGKEGRDGEVPVGKKHELFIPVSDGFASNPRSFIDNLTSKELFKIPDEVVDRFEELADDRTTQQIKHPGNVKNNNQWLPFHLKGCTRNDGLTGKDEKRLRVQEGDLMYFRPSPQSPQVAEISFSAVWRGRVNKTVHNYFPPELVQFNKNREKISPAELLFGFVQQDKHEKSLSFAGKVVLSSGKQLRETESVSRENEVTLKILASPKLPSPSLYFKRENYIEGGNYIAKNEMNNSSNIKPRGRKQYLHALSNSEDPKGVQKISRTGSVDDGGNYPWQSMNNDNIKQKVCIRPVSKDGCFTFEMEFENCTEWELGMLLYALRPSQQYRHKIGMGKSIGLGTVRIDINNLQFIHRKNRYNAGIIDVPRYNYEAGHDMDYFHNKFADTIMPEIKNSIELLGDPRNVRFPVHYPQVHGADIEDKTYQWFVANDSGTNNGQNGAAYKKNKAEESSLTELDEISNTIPGLERHEWLGR
ncbi:MAG TPA: TIGR03986 family CRISPR-associated RAMP protein [Desulfobacterales bacterium]|nr:TIGR03986 family CRISPR-associated RAMP protein [Desulfobacterales bacterium]